MTRIVVFSTVEKVENRVETKWVRGIGDKAEFTDVSIGYYVLLKGSHEAIHVGYEPPSFSTGDRVKITFERVQNER